MNKAEQEAGGWIKHDGSKCPYSIDDRVDFCWKGKRGILTRRALYHDWSEANFYHRPYISKDAQLNMAVKAIEKTLAHEKCQQHACHHFLTETLTKLKERRP